MCYNCYGVMAMRTVPASQIVTNIKNGWFGADFNMNIYRGCNHGCIYCDSRSECYRNAEFDTVYAKQDALRIIRDELRRKTHTGVISTGAMSDPYNIFEKEELLTRHALELVYAYGFGIAIATKSNLVCRDIDVLKDISGFAPVLVKLTITTTDDALARKIEPHAPLPSERLDAIAKLSGAGIHTAVLLMPVLPFITGSKENILDIVKKSKEAGAQYIYPAFGVTLRDRQRKYFYDALDRGFPGLRDKYVKRYGNRYKCTVPDVKAIWESFSKACDEAGIFYRMRDITRRYRRGYFDQLEMMT